MPDTPGPDNRDFSDDDLRVALGALSEEPNWARVGVTQRARARRRTRRAVATGLAAVIVVAALAVVATRDGPDAVPVATESSEATTTTASADPPTRLEIWPRTVPSGVATEVTAVVVNGDDEIVPVCGSDGALRIDGDRLVMESIGATASAGPSCAEEWVLPGQFSHEFTLKVPALGAGVYVVDPFALLEVVGSDTDLTGPGLTDEYTIRFAGADRLQDPQVTIPDEVVVVGGNRLALRWTSACNRPAYDIAFRYAHWFAPGSDTVAVELRTAYFVTTDCLGEPDNWSTVIDLPAPLRGARVIATILDPGPGADAAVVEATRVDAWPVGEPLPALVTMDREPLSMLDVMATDDAVTLAVSARIYDGCGAWVARPILDAGTMYVQAYAPADNEPCTDNPTPGLSFTVEPGTLPKPFGGNSYLIDP